MSYKKKKKETKNESGKPEEKRKERTRVRETDFLRVEATLHDHPLGPFELEVKEKIAAASSPLEELFKKEEELIRQKARKIAKYTLSRHLLKKARLTPKQMACYRLLYIEGVSNQEAARVLSVSKVRVCGLRRAITKALERVHRRQVERAHFSKHAYGRVLTRKQKLILRLRYQKRLSVEEIAHRLGRTKSSVHRVLKRITRKIS